MTLPSARERELRLLYQPVIQLQTGRVTGAELALVWRDHAGVLKPAEITAETRDWATATALYQNKEWSSAGFETVTLTLNVPPQLVGRDFREYLDQHPDQEALRAGYLAVAVTAASLARPSEATLDDLAALRSRGVSLTLTGVSTYEPLDLLDVYRFTTVKLAESLSPRLADALKSPHHPACLVRVLQEMSEMLDFDFVATGVGTRDQLNKYRSLGCGHASAQGPYIGRPVDAEAFRAAYLSPAPLARKPGLKSLQN